MSIQANTSGSETSIISNRLNGPSHSSGPKNIVTVIDGTSLSSDQKPLKNSPVLVLDDSTSALDVNTEKKLITDIKENYPDKTILISAHRLSSVISCDEILYMQDGMITERGTFNELMELNGRFAKVYKVQEAQNKEIISYNEENGISAARTGGY